MSPIAPLPESQPSGFSLGGAGAISRFAAFEGLQFLGHLLAGMSGDQLDVDAIGEPIEFDTTHKQLGTGIVRDLVNPGRVQLAANSDFILMCNVAPADLGTPTAWQVSHNLRLRDLTANGGAGEDISGARTRVFGPHQNDTEGGAQVMATIFSTTGTIEIEVQNDTAFPMDIRGDVSSLTIMRFR